MFFVRKSTYDKVVREKNHMKLHKLLDELKIRLLENLLEELQGQVKDYENKMSGLSKDSGSKEPKSEAVQDVPTKEDGVV